MKKEMVMVKSIKSIMIRTDAFLKQIDNLFNLLNNKTWVSWNLIYL